MSNLRLPVLFLVLSLFQLSRSASVESLIDEDFDSISYFEGDDVDSLEESEGVESERSLLHHAEDDHAAALRGYKEVMTTLEKYGRQSTPIDTGTYRIQLGEMIMISSPNYPAEYSPGSNLKWIIRPGVDVYRIAINCPVIRVVWSKGCKSDRFSIYTKRNFRFGKQRCGRINNYNEIFDSAIKIKFVSDGDDRTNRGVMCTLTGLGEPTTTPAPTTSYSRGCNITEPPVNFTDCLDAFYFTNVHHCLIDENKTYVFLLLTVCNECDMDIFAKFNFGVTLKIVVFPFPCAPTQSIVSLTSLYFDNAAYISLMGILIAEETASIDFALNELTSLEQVYFVDFNNTRNTSCAQFYMEENRCPNMTNTRGYSPQSDFREAPTVSSWMDILKVKEFRDLRDSFIPSERMVTPYSINWGQITHIKSLVVEGCVADLQLSNLTNLEFLCINMPPPEGGCAQVHNDVVPPLTQLENVYLDICENNVPAHFLDFSSMNLKCIELEFSCDVHTLDDEFMSLPQYTDPVSGACPQSVGLEVSGLPFDYIHPCPFHSLMNESCVQLYYNDVVRCDSCLNAWMELVHPTELDAVHATCETLAGTSYDMATYVNDFANPCEAFLTFNGCF